MFTIPIEIPAGRLPGGCETCTAHQTVEADERAGVIVLRVHHEVDCPTLWANLPRAVWGHR
jgi:hypothetical protein